MNPEASPRPKPEVELTGFGVFVKWLLLPALLAGVGYLAGPHLGAAGLDKVPAARSFAERLRAAGIAPGPAKAESGAKPGEPPPTSASEAATEFERIRSEPPVPRPAPKPRSVPRRR